MRAVNVLLAAFGTRGDVQPLMALALGFRRRGHTVTLAAPPDFEAMARGLGLPFQGVGERIDSFLKRVSDTRGALVPSKAVAAMPGWLTGQYAPLQSLVAGADVVIAASMTIAPMDLAEKFGKRVHYVAYCPQAIPSGEHPMAFVPHQGLPAWVNRLSFRFGAFGHDWKIRPHLDAARRELGLGPSPETWRHLLFQNLVVASEPALAPLPSDLPPHRQARQAGAFFLETNESLPEDVERFLQEGPAPIYVGFGSMPDVAPSETEAWVRQAAERAGVRVLLAGTGVTANARVSGVGVVDHHRLFPRCAAIVHHGGAGTTATAARAGVPQIIAPHVTDQFFWAKRLEQLKVAGPRVTARRRDVNELARAFERVTADQSLKESAKGLAGLINGRGVETMVNWVEAGNSWP